MVLIVAAARVSVVIKTTASFGEPLLSGWTSIHTLAAGFPTFPTDTSKPQSSAVFVGMNDCPIYWKSSYPKSILLFSVVHCWSIRQAAPGEGEGLADGLADGEADGLALGLAD